MKEFFWSELEEKSYGPFHYFADFSLVESAIQNFLTLIVNPSAFRNGMTLENRVKIEGAMSKNMSLKLQKP